MTQSTEPMASAPAPLSWAAHARAALALGVPLVGSQVAAMAMNITDTIMLGWYGVTELAAAAIATQMFFIVMIFGAGFPFAVLPMAAQAEGRRDQRQVRRSVRMGMWATLIYCLIMAPLLWFTESVLLALGQDEEVAHLAGIYMRIGQWSMLVLLMWWSLRSFLTAIERTRIVFWATLAGVFVNAGLNWVFIFGNWGAPELGVRGAAIATLGTNTLVFALLAAYATFSDRGRPYVLFQRFWRPDWQALVEVARVGLPIGAMMTIGVAMFISASLLMGLIGVVPLAAHGIALQLAALAFMVPMGLSQVATARVGHFHAIGDAQGVERTALTIMAMCLGFAMIGASIFFAVPATLVGLFLDEAHPESADVIAYAVPLLLIAACFQLVDSAQAVGSALLRGLKDTRVPMYIAFFAYWLVGLMLAWLLGFPLGFGGVGVWIGLSCGLATAAALLNWRFIALRRTVWGARAHR